MTNINHKIVLNYRTLEKQRDFKCPHCDHVFYTFNHDIEGLNHFLSNNCVDKDYIRCDVNGNNFDYWIDNYEFNVLYSIKCKCEGLFYIISINYISPSVSYRSEIATAIYDVETVLCGSENVQWPNKWFSAESTNDDHVEQSHFIGPLIYDDLKYLDISSKLPDNENSVSLSDISNNQILLSSLIRKTVKNIVKEKSDIFLKHKSYKNYLLTSDEEHLPNILIKSFYTSDMIDIVLDEIFHIVCNEFYVEMKNYTYYRSRSLSCKDVGNILLRFYDVYLNFPDNKEELSIEFAEKNNVPVINITKYYKLCGRYTDEYTYKRGLVDYINELINSSFANST